MLQFDDGDYIGDRSGNKHKQMRKFDCGCFVLKCAIRRCLFVFNGINMLKFVPIAKQSGLYFNTLQSL